MANIDLSLFGITSYKLQLVILKWSQHSFGRIHFGRMCTVLWELVDGFDGFDMCLYTF